MLSDRHGPEKHRLSAREKPPWQHPAVYLGLGCMVAAFLADRLLVGRSSGDLSLFVGRFHPLVVHLPIGVLVVVAVAEALSLWPRWRVRVDHAISVALPLLVVSAVAAFVAGHLLAGGGGFPSKLVLWHRRLTLLAILGAGLSLAAWGVAERTAWMRHGYRAILGLTMGVLTAGAHFGGSITRGEGYLTKYAPEPLRGWLGGEPPKGAAEDPPPTPGREPLVYADVIAPILRQRCVECHGAETVKAGLRLDSLEGVRKGGDGGATVVPGGGERSPLVARMRLPVEDEERMPPEGREGPSAEEIALVAWWIDRGANDTLRVRDALPPEASRALLDRVVVSAPSASALPATTSSATPSTSAAPTTEPSASAEPPQGVGTTPVPAPSARADGLLFRDHVAPILQAKCEKCHGEAKQKGKLRVDSMSALARGGAAGPAVVARRASDSPLVTRLQLPLTHDDHMPPPKSPQLTAREIEIIAWWVENGADEATTLASLPERLRGSGPPPHPTTEPTVSPPATASGPPSASAVPTVVASVDPSLPAPPLGPTIDLFREVTHVVLLARCGACHLDEDAAGGLRVDSLELLLQGGESGPPVVPGQPDQSLLLQRVTVALDDVDHMPPDGHPQPTPPEIVALRYWISTGAKHGQGLDTATLSPEVQRALSLAMVAARVTPQPGASPSAAPSAAPTATGAAPAPEDPLGPPPIQSGGCAGCEASAPPRTSVALWIVAAAALWLRHRRRRR